MGKRYISTNVTNILVPKLLGFAKIISFLFSFSISPYSVGETLHVAYKKYKIKKKKNLLFLVNTKYVSSRELKTSEFSFVLCTRENSDVFNTFDEIYLVVTSKSKILFLWTKAVCSIYFSESTFKF